MDNEASTPRTTGGTFAGRFEDLFSEKVYAIAALGVLLAWMWMGLTEGYPVFMDAAVDTVAVVLVLVSFAASVLSFGFVRGLDRMLATPAMWVVCAACVCVCCGLLLGVYGGTVPAQGVARTVLVRCVAVPVGLGVGALVQCCAVAFACLRPASMAVGFSLACAVMFAVYFSLEVCEGVGGQMLVGDLFCLLPLFAAVLLARSRGAVVDRLAIWPQQRCSFARGYAWMCVSFAVFFLAMASKAAMEPASEFAVASDTSVVCILAASLVCLYLVGVKREPMGVFRLLKNAYGVSVLVLTVCIALAPLSLDPLMSIVFNGDCVLLIMVLWLLTAFVAHSNEAYVCKVAGVALACAAVGMAAGWGLGRLIYAFFGHDRIYFSVGIACATAAFSTMGFSSRNFPYLTNHGEGAEKMRRIKEATALIDVDYDRLLAEEAGFSERESEVLVLLVAGYSATSVGDKLQISYHTARTHVRNIYRKLDVHSHAELIDAYQRFREQTAARLAG